jgi:2-methylcitrate dehydratase PrpD
MAAHGLISADVETVEIKTFHNAIRLAGHTPATLDEFSYSIAFPVACMIVRGQIGVRELQPETLNDPEILRVSKATQLIDDDHYTKISVGKRWAEVTLRTTDGRAFKSAPRSTRGDRDQPMNDAEIVDKFHRFADPVLGRARAEELADLSRRFDSLDAGDFSRLLDICLSAP